MNRLIRNRDILVIILLIVIICLFNFHISHGDRAPNRKLSVVSQKIIGKHHGLSSSPGETNNVISNVSQLSSNHQNSNNETSLLTTEMELLSTVPPIRTKQSYFDEIISMRNYWKICSNQKSPTSNRTVEENLFKVNDHIDCSTDSYMVFLIVSHIGNYKYREKIRQSWSSIRQLHSSKLTTLFFVYSDKPLTADQKKVLKSENDQYFDTVHIPVSFTIKTEIDFYLKMFEFSVFSCMKSDYFIIINDATFVNLPSLFETLLTNNDIKTKSAEKRSLMLCKVKKNIVAVRNKKSSWYVSNKEWSEKHYPPYCDLSNGIIMSQQVMRDLLFCSFYEKRFWINDVFLTGILPKKLSINVEAFMEDFSSDVMKNHHIYDDISRNIFLTEGHPFTDRIWRLLFSKSLKEL